MDGGNDQVLRDHTDLGKGFGIEPLSSFKEWGDVIRAPSKKSPAAEWLMAGVDLGR